MAVTAVQKETLQGTLRRLDRGMDTLRIDAFLEQMLSLVGEKGSLKCTLVNEQVVRVQRQDMLLCEVPLRAAKAKLRAICARLAVRCGAWSNREVSLYGDELEFTNPHTKQLCKIVFENTPQSQEFEIQAMPTKNMLSMGEENSL